MAAACTRPEAAPDLAIQWPRAGTTVRPGEEVHFRLAVEPAGNYAFQLTAAGSAIGRAEGAGIATVPWRVPLGAVPGRRIDVGATARNTATGVVAHAATHLVVGEEWHGTWTGRAVGTIYDDEAWAFFDFTVAADGTIHGEGTGKLFPRPVTTGGCEYTHTQVPAEFAVSVAGRRDDGHFALRLAGPGLAATRAITVDCGAGGRGAPPPALFDAFGMAAVHAPGLAPRVPIDGGRLVVEASDGAMASRISTAIGRGRRGGGGGR
jgi:hypothetical protein